MIRVSILGATGYSGGELLRHLIRHPGVAIQHITSKSSAGQSASHIHSFLRNRLLLKFENLSVSKITEDSDVVFSCFPPGAGLKVTAHLVKRGVRVIDLSADYRLPTAALYKAVYKQKHPYPAFLKSRAYGLPELFREKIVTSTLVANPGCYATAAILSIAPLLKKSLIDPRNIIVDAKSGVSGAGKKLVPNNLFCEVNEDLHAYGVASHRHQPEMEMVLTSIGSTSVQVTFVPHLIPMNRGILSATYVTLKKPLPIETLHTLYTEAYGKEPFMRILSLGENPSVKNVNSTNYCDIGFFQDKRAKRIIVIAAIDNLGKGAATQAIQNMNLLFHRPETEGLI